MSVSPAACFGFLRKKMENKQAAKWFLRVVSDVLLDPRIDREWKDDDVVLYSLFLSRMRDIAISVDRTLIEYDLCTVQDGRTKTSTAGVYLFIRGNLSLLSRVPELRPIVTAFKMIQIYDKRYRDIQDDITRSLEEKNRLTREEYNRLKSHQIKLLGGN